VSDDLRERSIPVSVITRTNPDPTSVIARTDAGPNVSVAQASLAALSIAAAAIHFAVMGEHFAEYVAFGVFFSVVAWSQALWAVGVIVLPSRRLLLVGLVGNAVVILVWLISRTTGLSIGPEAGAPEPAAFIDVLSTILEVAIVAGTARLVLRGRPTPSMRGLPVRLGLAGLVIALAVLTTWSVAAGATSGGEHGIDHGDHDEAASSGRPGVAGVNLGDGGWSVQVLVDASYAIGTSPSGTTLETRVGPDVQRRPSHF
jgi:hypothetical protein